MELRKPSYEPVLVLAKHGRKVARLANNVAMSGYIATDPQIFGKDKNVGRFRIRYDWGKKNRDTGKWDNEANFFSVVGFGAEMAEKISGYKKGEQVSVIGRLQQQQKEDKEYISIVADVIALTDPESEKFKPEPNNDDDWLNS